MRLVAVLMMCSISASADSTEVTIGAGVGGGSVELYGARYGTADGSVEIAAARWLSPTVGVGVRLTDLVALPLREPKMDGYPLAREVPWSIEPEVLVRTPPVGRGRVRLGWVASAGAGIAWLQTQELCGGGGHLFEEHDVGGSACVIVKERSTAAVASLTGGGYLDVGPVAAFLGVRATADTGGDRSAGLVANLGVTF